MVSFWKVKLKIQVFNDATQLQDSLQLWIGLEALGCPWKNTLKSQIWLKICKLWFSQQYSFNLVFLQELNILITKLCFTHLVKWFFVSTVTVGPTPEENT